MINKADMPVYLYYFVITLFKGLDYTKSSYAYIFAFLLGLVFLIIRIIRQKYSFKQIIIMIALLLIGVAIYLNGGNSAPLFAIVSICSLKDINTRSILKLIFIVHALTFSLKIIASIIGVIPNICEIRDRFMLGSQNRCYFGYQHPNLVQAHLLSLTILYLFIYPKHHLKAKILVLFILNTLLYANTASRTSYYICVVFLIMYTAIQISEKTKKILAMIGRYSFIALFSAAIVLSFNYKNENIIKIDNYLTGRLYYTNKIVNSSKPVFIGKANYADDLMIDNSYISILYKCGILMTIIVVIANMKVAGDLYKKKEYERLIIMLAFNLLCFAEDLYFFPTINISLIFLSKDFLGE